MDPTDIIIAASVGGLTAASGWIAAWWQRGRTSAVKDTLRSSQAHSSDLKAQLLAATAMASKMEAGDADYPDSHVMQALADALHLLPVADAQRIRLKLHAARSGEGAGLDPEHVSGTSGPATIAEFEDDESG